MIPKVSEDQADAQRATSPLSCCQNSLSEGSNQNLFFKSQNQVISSAGASSGPGNSAPVWGGESPALTLTELLPTLVKQKIHRTKKPCWFSENSQTSESSECAKCDVTPRQGAGNIPAPGWSHGIASSWHLSSKSKHNKIKADEWSLNLNYLCSVSVGLSVGKELWCVHGFFFFFSLF